MSDYQNEPKFVKGEFVSLKSKDKEIDGIVVEIVNLFIGSGQSPILGRYDGYIYKFVHSGHVYQWPEPLLNKLSGESISTWSKGVFVPEDLIEG